MTQLSLSNILARLQNHCQELVPLQMLDAAHPGYGGVVNPPWDLVDPKITEHFINDVIRISPGAYAHGMWQMRDAEPAPNQVRILRTFLTPVNDAIHLRVSAS